MELLEAKGNGVVVLGVKGRVDASNASALEEKLLGLIAAGERGVVLDFTHLDYISSAGLRALLMAAKRMSAVAGKLALAGLQDAVKEVFDIAGFSSIFQLFKDQKEAVAAVQ